MFSPRPTIDFPFSLSRRAIHRICASILLTSLSLVPALAFAADENVIDIPKAAAAVTDPAWVKTAYHADVLTPLGAKDKDSGHAALALAWNDEGLLIHIAARDSTPIESRDVLRLWAEDSIEVFIGSLEAKDYLQLCFAPGRTPVADEPRVLPTEKRAKHPEFAKPQLHVEEKSPTSYAMSVLVPWSNLVKPPAPGDVIRLQVQWIDGIAQGIRLRRGWFPKPTWDMEPSYHVRLAAKASPDQKAIALPGVNRQWKPEVRVIASADMVGKQVEITGGKHKMKAGTLKAGGTDGSELDVELSSEIAAMKGEPLEISVAGKPLTGKFTVPDPVAARKALLTSIYIVAPHPIFSEDAFPLIDFSIPEMADNIFGPYKMEIRYFDADWNEVTFPGKPGRYGALVNVRTADGITDTRRVTLFKTPKKYSERADAYGVHLELPEAFGLPTDTGQTNAIPIQDQVNWLMIDSMDNPAVLVADLYEVAANPAQKQGLDLWSTDNEWWLNLTGNSAPTPFTNTACGCPKVTTRTKAKRGR